MGLQHLRCTATVERFVIEAQHSERCMHSLHAFARACALITGRDAGGSFAMHSIEGPPAKQTQACLSDSHRGCPLQDAQQIVARQQKLLLMESLI